MHSERVKSAKTEAPEGSLPDLAAMHYKKTPAQTATPFAKPLKTFIIPYKYRKAVPEARKRLMQAT